VATKALIKKGVLSDILSNVKQEKVRLSKAQKAALALRKKLWPKITDEHLWLRKSHDGFTTIPRTMPLMIEVINDASKQVTEGKSVPAGKTYLGLWCRVFDEAFVKIEAESTAAMEVGYAGERNVSTWREHIRVLQRLGFIEFESGPAGPCQYILLINPYLALKELHKKGWVQKSLYLAIFVRAQEIGANDLAEDDE
jgi:hypothetical protein